MTALQIVLLLGHQIKLEIASPSLELLYELHF